MAIENENHEREDIRLRIICLQIAHVPSDEPEDVVKRAKKYEEFLQSDSEN